MIARAISIVLFPALALAQPGATPVSRADAVRSALAFGARLGVARADTTLALAQLVIARARPNPTLSSVYSRATPQYHVTMDQPFDWPGIRGARVGAAEAGRTAARYRYAWTRALVALDADTTYTRVLAALARTRLSERNARDADSLRRIAIARRDAGDASDLDVALASVNSGQAANAAAADTLAMLSTLLDLQAAMGLPADGVRVVPTDSLSLLPAAMPVGDSGTAPPLSVASARAAVTAAGLAARLQRRSRFAQPSLMAGFETGDPTGSEPGLLPTVGLSLPLPLFDRNRGPIAQALAEESRARAELALAEVESRTEVARASREFTIAQAKVTRDRQVVASAARVAAMSLTAYRESAAALPSVLEAQRNAREVLAQYVDDLAAAWIAAAKLRAFTLTTPAS